MDEISEFFNKAENKLKSSKILFDAEDYSDSVSLSYYAMLLVSKALLVKKGENTNKHSVIIKRFAKIYVHENNFNQNIFKYLIKTQFLSNQSNYEAIDDITKQIAKTKIKEAEEYVEEAKKFV